MGEKAILSIKAGRPAARALVEVRSASVRIRIKSYGVTITIGEGFEETFVERPGLGPALLVSAWPRRRKFHGQKDENLLDLFFFCLAFHAARSVWQQYPPLRDANQENARRRLIYNDVQQVLNLIHRALESRGWFKE